MCNLCAIALGFPANAVGRAIGARTQDESDALQVVIVEAFYPLP